MMGPTTGLPPDCARSTGCRTARSRFKRDRRGAGAWPAKIFRHGVVGISAASVDRTRCIDDDERAARSPARRGFPAARLGAPGMPYRHCAGRPPPRSVGPIHGRARPPGSRPPAARIRAEFQATTMYLPSPHQDAPRCAGLARRAVFPGGICIHSGAGWMVLGCIVGEIRLMSLAH